jgi:Ca-activated chloride channel homolog
LNLIPAKILYKIKKPRSIIPFSKAVFYIQTVILFILFISSDSSTAQGNYSKTRILFVFDASQSMFGNWQSGRKIDGAKKLMSQIIDTLAKSDHVEIALRVYGHQTLLRGNQKDCEDTKLEVPFASRNHNKIKIKLSEITPKGTTPIALSLEKAAGDFPECKTCRNIIILITDGIEECDGDPCAVSYALRKKGVVLKPFIIGIGLTADIMKEFECVGTYYDASSEESFSNIMNVAISQALNSTTAQVSLMDTKSKATETNVNMTFYDNFSGEIKHNYIHTLNHKGYPDTLTLDPIITYDIVVHTLPQVKKEGVTLKPGKHNTIEIPAPQGILELKVIGYNEYKALKAIVREAGGVKTLHIQDVNVTQNYLVGKYDLEILTIPRIHLKGIEISQSHTTTLEITEPGIVSVFLNGAGYGSFYLEEKKNLKWVHNLDESRVRQNIALQPGNYRLVFRSVNSKESIYTIERKFKIEPGGSVSIKL